MDAKLASNFATYFFFFCVCIETGLLLFLKEKFYREHLYVVKMF